MTLSKFNVQVDLGIGGIQSGVSPEKVEKVVPGGLQQLKNADISVAGRIQKRRAFDIPLPNDATNTNYDKVFSLFSSMDNCYRVVDNIYATGGTIYTGNWFKSTTSYSKRMRYGHRVLQKLSNPANKTAIPTWNTIGAVPSVITSNIIQGGVGVYASPTDTTNTKIASNNNPQQATVGYNTYSGRKYICVGLLSSITSNTVNDRQIIFHVKDYDTNQTVTQLIIPPTTNGYAGDIDVTPSYDGRYFFCGYYDYTTGKRYCRTFDASTGTFLSTTVELFTAATVGSTTTSTKTALVIAYQSAIGTLAVRKFSFAKASGGSGATPAPDSTYSGALVGTFLSFPAINAYVDYGAQEHVGVFWSEDRVGSHYFCGQMLNATLGTVGATATYLVGSSVQKVAQHTSAKTISIPYDTNSGGTITNSNGQSLVMYQITDTTLYNNTFILGFFFGENAGVITFEQVMSARNVALASVPFGFSNVQHGTNSRYKNHCGAIDDNYFLVTKPSPSGTEEPSVYIMQFSFNVTASVAPYFTLGYVRCVAKIDRLVNSTNSGNDQPWSSKVAVLSDSEQSVIAPIGSPGMSFDFYKLSNASSKLGDIITDSYKDICNGGFALQINDDTCLEREPLSIDGAVYTTTDHTGALTVNGTYQLCVVKRIEYASGLLSRGAPSVPVTVTLSGAHNQINCIVQTIDQISNTSSNSTVIGITYELYRTTAGGTTFYLENFVSSAYPYFTQATLVAALSDTAILTRPILYTNGGVIENVTAPNITSITKYKGRIVASVGQTEPAIWISKEQTNSSIGQFTDVFKSPIATRGIDVTVVRELDDKLIIFAEDSIYYLYGEGPNDTGTTASFGQPIKISDNVGCISNKAIARLDNKIIFRGKEGFYFLLSNLSIQKVSFPVQYFSSLGNFTVTSTVQLDNRKQVQFYTSNGYRIVYFTDTEQWTVDNIGASLAAKYKDYVVVVKNTGTTYSDIEMQMESPIDNPASWTYSDNIGGYYPLEIKTGWITFNGLQSLARVWRLILLGRAYTNCTLKVGFSYDYNPAVVDIKDLTIDTTSTLAYSDTDLYETLQPAVSSSVPTLQRRIHMTRQKLQAVQITIWDTAQSGIGKSFELNQITFEVGLRQGIGRLSEAQSS